MKIDLNDPASWAEYVEALRRLGVPEETIEAITYEPPHEPKPYCGVYWIITTCLTAIALGLGFGALLWLVLS